MGLITELLLTLCVCVCVREYLNLLLMGEYRRTRWHRWPFRAGFFQCIQRTFFCILERFCLLVGLCNVHVQPINTRTHNRVDKQYYNICNYTLTQHIHAKCYICKALHSNSFTINTHVFVIFSSN